MRIDDQGNVGIGTTEPGEKLDVNGNLKITDGMSLVVNNTGADSNLYLGNYTDGVFSFSGDRANLTIEGKVNAGEICITDSCLTTWQAIGAESGWTDDGNVVRLTDSNNQVGIGTVSPSAGAKLHIFTDDMVSQDILKIETDI